MILLAIFSDACFLYLFLRRLDSRLGIDVQYKVNHAEPRLLVVVHSSFYIYAVFCLACTADKY